MSPVLAKAIYQAEIALYLLWMMRRISLYISLIINVSSSDYLQIISQSL